MARRYFGDHRVESVLAQIPADALLYLIYENRAGIYPFLLGLPRTVHPILLNAKPALESLVPFRKNAYLLSVDTSPTSVQQLKHHQILWQPEPDAALPKGGLYHRN